MVVIDVTHTDTLVDQTVRIACMPDEVVLMRWYRNSS